MRTYPFISNYLQSSGWELASYDEQEVHRTLRKVADQVQDAPTEYPFFLRWLKALTFERRDALDAICDTLGLDIPRYLRDRRPYLSADQVCQLAREGFTIGAHSKTHRRLFLLTDPQEIEDEIVNSCDQICRLTGKDQSPFAFPFMRNGINRDHLVDIRTRNPQVGLMFDTHGLPKDRSFLVQRQSCDGSVGPSLGRASLRFWIRRTYLGQIYKALFLHGSLGPG